MFKKWIMKTRMTALSVCIALVCVATVQSLAQSTTQGGISGTVFDATGAVVPNAKITIHNDATNADVAASSGESGDFKAPLLAPGTYTVTISVPGFKEERSSGVVVQVNQVTELNSHLTTGSASQTVEVTASIPVLNFDSAAFGGHLDTKEIEGIPINNRRWSSLALTTPGVTNDASGFGLLSFRAMPSVSNSVQIDGVDDNQAFFSEERGRTRAGYSTSQAAVREFQVNTGVYSAELGHAVGGVVNSVTKQGGNQLHGEVYFFHRGDEFSSKNEKTTIPNPVLGGPAVVIRPKDKRNQYGFAVGGPLIKDKLFWFYAFDTFHRNFPGTAVSGNPSTLAAACSSALLTATGASAAQCATALADLQGDLGTVPRFGNQLINTPKLTWQINPKNVLDVYYHRLRWDSPGGVQTQAALAYARDAFGTDFVKLDYGVAKLNSLITSRVTNEIRYQYARELNDEGQQPFTDYSNAHVKGSNGVYTYASIATSGGGFNVGSPYYSYRVSYPDERKWQVGDTASLQVGRHTIRFGADLDHNYDLQNNLFQSNGAYSYANATLFLADILKPSGVCNPLTASGTPTLSTTGNNYGCHSGLTQGFGGLVYDLSTLDTGYFVQDDWKVMPGLTLNLGVRYDYEMLPAPYASAVATDVPQEANHPSDKNNISPRFGFSWDPFGKGKTVVHGGFGLYYGRIPNGVLLNTYVNTGTANGQTQLTAFNATNLNTTAAPVYIKFPQTPTTKPPAGLFSVQYLDANLHTPYTEQMDLSIQQDLGAHSVFSIAYLGALGKELPNYINTNLDPTKFYNVTYTTACNQGICNGIPAGTTFTQRVYSSRYTTSGANTINRAYNAITDTLSNANSNYNALSVDITNRQWKMITFDANYTWAHALDYNVAGFTSAGTNNWLDPFANGRSNYGTSSLSIRHRAVGWAVVKIPGSEGHGPLTYVTNGWSIRPLVQVQSGLPYSYGISTGSPGQQTDGTCSGPGAKPLNDCLQPYSSGIAGTGVSSYIPFFGRNTLTQPRDIVLDARLQKDFRVKEGVSVELMAEGFNLANHRNITSVNTGAFSLSGNTLTATVTNATSTTPVSNFFGIPSTSGVNGNYAYQVRQFQFGARVSF
ncbi:MAG: carboxypeptidase regulatory-like domain-containing protein [Acidobacteriota bacterium]|nr:carboxypeptidase regulatory-like domain-containing protein [Acidobacteriota bacterium]